MSSKEQTRLLLYNSALVVILCLLGVGGWLTYGLRTGKHLPGTWPAKWYFNTEYCIPWVYWEFEELEDIIKAHSKTCKD